MSKNDNKAVGDAWGKLAGVFVDAALSHHNSHCCDDETHTGTDTSSAKGERRRPNPIGEIVDIFVSAQLGCRPSWTGTKGEVIVKFTAPNPMSLGGVQMHAVRAGENMGTAVHDGVPSPLQMQPGDNEVIVALDPYLPRAMYLGRMRPSTGAQPDKPVVIYIDDVV